MGKLAARFHEEPRRVRERGGRLRADEPEELDVDVHELRLLRQRREDRDGADGRALERERDDGGGRVERAAREIARRLVRDLTLRDGLADGPGAGGDARDVGRARALGRDRDELGVLVVAQVHDERRGADELREELLEVPQHAADAARAEELRGGDVEVREVRELALDLGVELRGAVFALLRAARAGEELLLLFFERLDLAEQVADGLVAREVRAELAVLGLERRDAVAQALALLEQLFGELRALAEELLNERVALLHQVLRRAIAVGRASLRVRHRASCSPPGPRALGSCRTVDRGGSLQRALEEVASTPPPRVAPWEATACGGSAFGANGRAAGRRRGRPCGDPARGARRRAA